MRSLALVLALTAAACGSSSTPSVTSADVQRLNTLSRSTVSAAAAYDAQATAMTDTGSCSGAENAYDSQVRPMIGEMQGLGPAMDGRMGSMRHASDADVECAAGALLAELDHHKGVACASSTDMAPNKAEAHRHVASMTLWADHQTVRSYELGSTMGMGMGGMAGSGMTTGHCVHQADGSYTMQP